MGYILISIYEPRTRENIFGVLVTRKSRMLNLMRDLIRNHQPESQWNENDERIELELQDGQSSHPAVPYLIAYRYRKIG